MFLFLKLFKILTKIFLLMKLAKLTLFNWRLLNPKLFPIIHNIWYIFWKTLGPFSNKFQISFTKFSYFAKIFQNKKLIKSKEDLWKIVTKTNQVRDIIYPFCVLYSTSFLEFFKNFVQAFLFDFDVNSYFISIVKMPANCRLQIRKTETKENWNYIYYYIKHWKYFSKYSVNFRMNNIVRIKEWV